VPNVTVELDIGRGTNKYFFSDYDASRLINLFLTEDQTGTSFSPKALFPSPGTLAFPEEHPTSPGRGIIEGQDGESMYTVYGNKFYKVIVDKTNFSLDIIEKGTLTTTTGLIDLDQTLTQVGITDGENIYIYTIATDDFDIVTTPFAPPTPSSIIALDGYFFVISGSRIYSSNINDGLTWNSLTFITPNSSSSEPVVIADNSLELWVFTRTAIEVYTDNANAAPRFPFSEQLGARISRGCLAPLALSKLNNSFVWIDDRGYVVMSQGYDVVEISTESINRQLASLNDLEAAESYLYPDDSGHWIYQVTFPEDELTLNYDFMSKTWSERTSLLPANNLLDDEKIQTRHLTNGFALHKNWRLCTSFNDGKLYRLSQDYSMDNNEVILRTWLSPIYHFNHNYVTINQLRFKMQSGVGLPSGQGSNPVMMFSQSVDGGHTFGSETLLPMGQLGQYGLFAQVNCLGIGRYRQLKITVSDPVPVAIFGLTADIEVSN